MDVLACMSEEEDIFYLRLDEPGLINLSGRLFYKLCCVGELLCRMYRQQHF
jgi:hypothetical protein